MSVHRHGAALLLALACVLPSGVQAATSACPTLLDRTALRLQDEQPQKLCQYAGKVLLIVNTASACGYTPQYQGLEALHERYRDRGLVVLGFPSNDFGQQESGSNQEIADFCENQFSVRFPMFTKGPVTGGAAQPLYTDLRRLSGTAPAWNFHKYLVSRDGRQVRSFASGVTPDSPELTRLIEQWLAR